MTRRILVVTHPTRLEFVDARDHALTALWKNGLEPVTEYEHGKSEPVEAALVLGGDGTMLHAAQLTYGAGVPLLGVNLGRVGFLAELERDGVDAAVKSLADKTYRVEERGTLQLRVTLPDGTVRTGWALNEATVERANPRRTLEVTLSVDGRPLSSFGCDGVVVATATGSTAHAFSAGGPVVWPDVDALLFVPLAAHALFSRPLVVGPQSWFGIRVSPQSFTGGVIVCDGARSVEAPVGTDIEVRRAHRTVRLARMGDAPFAQRLIDKFSLPTEGWRGERADPSREPEVLHELSIENLGVIASARLTLGRGLTVVTGETGAGKTMVLTGLALVTGGKADPALVRGGSEAAVAEAVVDVPEGSEAWAALAEADVRRNDDGTVTVTRTLGAATRSRTVVGGRQVPQSLLADCAAEVVTVHGQAEQARLRGAAKQRETLDRHAGAAHLALLEEYRGAWAALAAAREALEAMRNGAAAERAVMGQLRDDLAAIEAVGPRLGEDEELAAEARVLENAEAVRQGAAMAREVLAGDAEGTVAALLEAARKGLAEAGRHDASLADLEARVAEHAYGLADVAAELGRYLSALDADPARLEQVQERRSALAGLARRLGRDLPGVLDYAREAAARLEALDNWDESLAAREAEVVGAQAALDSLAARLSQGRREAAVRLAQSVNAELAQLAMPQAAFAVEVEPVEAGPFGADSVTMTLAAHPGASPRPVADAASGGELSRIMLAIEVSLAQGNVAPGHTFVFDEVDAGVGGKAAIDVGRRLAELARTQQVLVVTHLAQVAAFADHHVVVTKGTTGEVTTSQVVEVTGEDRVLEVARLLSGQEDSSTARAHALELIEGSTLAR